MENRDMYMVEREDYVGFFRSIKPDCIYTERKEDDEWGLLQVYSLKTNKLLGELRHNLKSEDDFYYIYEFPDQDECCPPKAIRRITLETREEVEAFFQILSQAMGKGEKK